MSDEDEMSYARFDSVEGLLQRGRGLGAVRALQDPQVAAPFVYDAIRRDWRWDGFDERSRYLAGLVRELGLSPAPVVELLSGDEQQCRRAVDVLELLALGGCDEAREALRSHVREGAHWVHVLESVSGLWPAQWWEAWVRSRGDGSAVSRSRRGSPSRGPDSGSRSSGLTWARTLMICPTSRTASSSTSWPGNGRGTATKSPPCPSCPAEIRWRG